MQEIAVIGSGNVGGSLAIQLARAGHSVTLCLRGEPSEKAQAVIQEEPLVRSAQTVDAVAAANVVLLATPSAVAVSTVETLQLDGKILIDCTNPVGPGLTHGLMSARSGSELIAAAAQGAHVVKAFTVYGFENFHNSAYPGYGDLLPAMPIAGDHPAAKELVQLLCSELGFEGVDCGPLSMSLHLEHQTLLWVHMARLQGQGTDLVWARLRR